MVNFPRSQVVNFPRSRAVERQVPIGSTIEDLLVPAAKLVIEVGGSHASRKRADERRDSRLRRLGYRILRLEAELVMKQLPVALERIRAALGE